MQKYLCIIFYLRWRLFVGSKMIKVLLNEKDNLYSINTLLLHVFSFHFKRVQRVKKNTFYSFIQL